MDGDGRGLRFGSVAEQYDAFRPPPPPGAAEWLGDVAGLQVLEVAAGTGLWTRFLLSHGARVTVVEPDDAMRAVLERQSPDVVSLAGHAEQLPCADVRFDAVLVSSAWHWFEQPAASIEIARVLRDGGPLIVVWNGFSREVAWVDALTSLRDRSNDGFARPRGWSADLSADGPFVDAHDFTLDWTWRRSVEELVSLFGTYSAAIVCTDEQRHELEDELRRRLEGYVANGSVDVPMTLRGTIAARRLR